MAEALGNGTVNTAAESSVRHSGRVEDGRDGGLHACDMRR